MISTVVVPAMRRTLVVGALFGGLVQGCARQADSIQLAAAEVMSQMTGVGRAPAYAVSPDGGEAMLWVTAPDGGAQGTLHVMTGSLHAAIADSLGPIEAHDESPPKLAFGADRRSLYVLYVVARLEEGRRFPASALRFTRSRDGGATWSDPVTVTDDEEFGSHNFHALHVARDGSVYVSWLDGRHGVSNVYVARSTDGGVNWHTNARVFDGEACPCCRTAMASDADGTLYLSWRTVLPGNVRDIVIARSADHGATWSEPRRVHADNWVFPGCPHAGPALQTDAAGRVHIAWWTGLEGKAGVYYARSSDKAETWSTPYPIGVAEFSRPASVQMSPHGDSDVFVAWNDGTEEIPSIVLRVSRDGGKSFGDRIQVSEPGRHAFFPVLGVRDSTFAIMWSEQSHDYATAEAESHPDMSDPNAVMPLHRIGETNVVLRRGRY